MAWRPPSTGMLTPVMYDESSDAKNAMVLATSIGSPTRPKAWVVFECSKN